jgi:PPP family 3-phenylpropionic acid transporter
MTASSSRSRARIDKTVRNIPDLTAGRRERPPYEEYYVNRTDQPQVSVLWIKLIYVAVYSSYGATSVYLSLFYRRIGLTDSQIGFLIALQPLVMLIAGPLWSIIGDRLGLRARLLALVTGFSIVPMLAMGLTTNFWLVTLYTALYALFNGPIQPLTDSMALTALGDQRHKYGVIRAFGSLGYAPVMWIVGLIIQGRDIRWIFVVNALFMGAACLLTLRTRVEQRALQGSIASGLGTLLRNHMWRVFMIAVFIAMALQTVSFSYFGLYMDTLNASEGLIGFSGALGSGSQVLLLIGILPWMLRSWGSQRLMLIGFAGFAVRFALWAFIPSPWVVTASQLLQGLTFGAALLASVDFAAQYAPEGMAATSQAIVTSLVAGLGRSFGGILCGGLYDGIGPQGTFGVFTVMAIAGLLSFGLLWRKSLVGGPAATPAVALSRRSR